MLTNVATDSDDVGHRASARRDAARMIASAKNGIAVALVDAGRDDEEGDGEDGQPERASSAGPVAGRRPPRTHDDDRQQQSACR